MPFVRSAYNYNTNYVSDDTGLLCLDPSLAQQQFRDDADPNFVMKQFAKTRDLTPFQSSKPPQYGDFSGISDYHTALNVVLAANESFDQLPANIRNRFKNDPGDFLEFFNDPANRAEAIDLGLIPKDISIGTSEPPATSAEGPVGMSVQPASPALVPTHLPGV